VENGLAALGVNPQISAVRQQLETTRLRTAPSIDADGASIDPGMILDTEMALFHGPR